MLCCNSVYSLTSHELNKSTLVLILIWLSIFVCYHIMLKMLMKIYHMISFYIGKNIYFSILLLFVVIFFEYHMNLKGINCYN